MLDTLRAVGALAVLTTHTAFQSGDYVAPRRLGHPALPARRRRGDLLRAVRLPALAPLARPVPPPGARARRSAATTASELLRIFPVYVVTVVVALTLVQAGPRALGSASGCTTLLLGDIYVASRGSPRGSPRCGASRSRWRSTSCCRCHVLGSAPGRGLRAGPDARCWWRPGRRQRWWHLGLAERGRRGLPRAPDVLAAGLPGVVRGRHRPRPRPTCTGQASPEPARLGAPAAARWARCRALLGLAGGLMLLAATPLAGPTLLFVATPAESLFKHLALRRPIAGAGRAHRACSPAGQSLRSG